MHLFTRRDQREYRTLTDHIARVEAENRHLRGLVSMAEEKIRELQNIITLNAHFAVRDNPADAARAADTIGGHDNQ